MNFLKQLWGNRTFIAGMLLVLFLVLFLRQCNETRKLKDELEITKHIAKENVLALNDKEIQLKVTKDQLAIMDSDLHKALIKIDSLKNIKSKVITVIKPVYMAKNVVIPSEFVFDSLNNRYGLAFNNTDLVRTIKGVSWFKIDNSKQSLKVIPQNTNINDFRLNFAFVVSQYNDYKTNYTRTKIVAFNVKENGELCEEIPESMLNIDFRNAQILDKPFEKPKPEPQMAKTKMFNTGFGLSISPLAVGVIMGPKNTIRLGWTPNIGLSYCITFREK